MLMHKVLKRMSVVALAFVSLLLFQLQLAELAQAQEGCQAKLLQAENDYRNGRFDEALTLVNECMTKGDPNEADRQRALKLQILIYIAKDYIEQAKAAISKLLDLVPQYKPDPDQDPPAYIQIFEKVKSEREAGAAGKAEPKKEVKSKKRGSAKWLLIGGGVVVAGVGAAVALGGGGGGTTPPPTSQQLPTPPPLP